MRAMNSRFGADLRSDELRRYGSLPTYFRAALTQAASRSVLGVRAGTDEAMFGSYAIAGWSLATRWDHDLSGLATHETTSTARDRLYGIADLTDTQAEPAVICWLSEYLPDFLDAVPRRRLATFARGFLQRIREDLW